MLAGSVTCAVCAGRGLPVHAEPDDWGIALEEDLSDFVGNFECAEGTLELKEGTK